MTKSATSRLMDHVVFTRSLLLLRSAPPAEELLSDLKAAKLCIDASYVVFLARFLILRGNRHMKTASKCQYQKEQQRPHHR